MACRTYKGEKSLLWDKLFQHTGSEEIADTLYQNIFLSKDFIDKYGDWTQGKQNDNMLLESNGEPLIRTKESEWIAVEFKAPYNGKELKVVQSYHIATDYSKEYNQFELKSNNSSFNRQLTDKGITQKEVADRLMNSQADVKASDTDYKANGITMKRVSEFKKTLKGPSGEDGYYADNKIDYDKYENSRQWGNTIDAVLRGIIDGKSLSDIKKEIPTGEFRVLPNAIDKLHEQLSVIVKEQTDKGNIVLSQVVLYNTDKGVAGTADMVVVLPNGKIQIWDLKTNTKGFHAPYHYMSKGKEQEWRYDKNFYVQGKKKASTQEQHIAQLSLYKGLAQSMGFELDDTTQGSNQLRIIPVKLQGDDTTISDGTVEEVIKLDANRNITALADSNTKPVDNSVTVNIFEKVLKTLQSKLFKLRKENKSHQQIQYLEDLIAKIAGFNYEKGMVDFIDQTYNDILGNDKFKGWAAIMAETIDNVRKGKFKEGFDAINKLREYYEIANLYNPKNNSLISEMIQFYNKQLKEGVIDAEQGSPIWKAKELLVAFDNMQSSFNDIMPTLLAKLMAGEIGGEVVKDISKDIKVVEKRLKEAQDTMKAEGKSESYILRKTARDREILQKMKEGIGMDSKGNVDVAKQIELEIRTGGYKDINSFDMWLSPAISQNNLILGSFVKMVKSRFEAYRQELREFQFEAKAAFDAFNNGKTHNSAEFNKGMYEVVERYAGRDEEGAAIYKKRAQFVSPIDIAKYERAKEDFIDSISKLGQVQQREAMQRWYKENRQMRDKSDITLHGTVILKGYDTIMREKKEDLAKRIRDKAEQVKALETWEASLEGQIALSMPKMSIYSNQAYTNMTSNEKMSKYYAFLTKTYFKAQDRMPPRNEYDRFTLPSVSKSSNDRFRENGIKDYLKYKASDITSLRAEDNDSVGEDVGTNFKTIPMLYSQDMDASDVSLDLIASVMRFEESSHRYKAQNDLAPLSDSLLALVENTTPSAVNSHGVKVLDKAAATLGMNGYEHYLRKHRGNNVATMLEMFIDTQIYGKHNKPAEYTAFGRTFDMGKIANGVMSFAARTNLTFNPLGSVANALQANVMLRMEAATGQYFDKATWRSALATYGRGMTGFISDYNKGMHTSLLGQMTDVFDAIQGEFKDNYGRTMSQAATKKAWSWDTAFFLQHAGEHQVQVSTMIAVLKGTKVKDDKGNEASLYDAYTTNPNNGKIELKKGWDLTMLGNMVGIVPRAVQDKLHAINKRLNGVYNNFDRPMIERHWYGRLLTFYRKFLVSGFKARWKGYGIDYELGQSTEGSYRTFFRLLTGNAKKLISATLPWSKEAEGLTDYERGNARRAAFEMLAIGMTGALVWIMKGINDAAGDDDEKKYTYLLYWAMRLNTELGIYGGFGDPNSAFLPNIKEVQKQFKTPTVAYYTIEKATNFIYQCFSPYEVYQKDTALAQKGDSKMYVSLLKLFGMNGYNADPESAVNVITMATGGK